MDGSAVIQAKSWFVIIVVKEPYRSLSSPTPPLLLFSLNKGRNKDQRRKAAGPMSLS